MHFHAHPLHATTHHAGRIGCVLPPLITQAELVACCKARLQPLAKLHSTPLRSTTTHCLAPAHTAPPNTPQMMNRPQLLPYVPTATDGAAVVASDKMARFTVLTDMLIRMEYAKVAGVFEDRASLAVLHRQTPKPPFTSNEAGGVLTITTTAVKLTYTVGKGPFTADTLSVAPVNASDTFPGWKHGQANPGNLLGTIRGQDGQSATDLNCTLNAGIDDNGEFNHCEWGECLPALPF
jgi:hypothetical protein